MQKSLYEEFFERRKDDETELLEFGRRHSVPVQANLLAIKDRVQFLSEIIEYRFGNFLSKFFSDLKHEPSPFTGSAYTPDWTFKNGTETIVAEVFRLNPTQKDASEMNFSDNLSGILGEIKKDYVLKLDYKFETLSQEAKNLQSIKNYIATWLNCLPDTTSSITYNSEIHFTVFAQNRGLSKVNTIGPYRSINFDYRRLTGVKSQLFRKLKYANELGRHGMPYLICIHLTFESWFEPKDLYERLYGLGGSFHNDEPFEEFYPGAIFHDISEGLYYSNESIKKCLSGIIVYYGGKFIFFPNYSNCNRLSPKSQVLLKPYLYEKLSD